MPRTAPYEMYADILTVYGDAIRVPFADVRAGDWVFDMLGNRYKLVAARVLKNGNLSIKREGFVYTEHFSPDAPYHPGQFTIVPAHGWDRNRRVQYLPVPGAEVQPDGFVFSEFVEYCRCGEAIGSGAAGDASSASMLLAEHANEANGRGEWY